MDGEEHRRQGKDVWHVWEQRKPVWLLSGQGVCSCPGSRTIHRCTRPLYKFMRYSQPCVSVGSDARDEVREVMGGDPCWVSQDIISTLAFILSQTETLGRFEAEE